MPLHFYTFSSLFGFIRTATPIIVALIIYYSASFDQVVSCFVLQLALQNRRTCSIDAINNQAVYGSLTNNFEVHGASPTRPHMENKKRIAPIDLAVYKRQVLILIPLLSKA
ncbi:hypothetical protein C5167_033465 [Papaver somniferum]|uniref:Uncharacterized protein n=1 Tax=Papaver somniferum TaxID=3469 RepID=A0A4Y7KEB4_PAPSO|nr:hypothetical protein C5167_033465 [Papaver somniferum]